MITQGLGMKNNVGKGSRISSLKGKELRKIVDDLWPSKLWYGLHLCATVRADETQEKKWKVTDAHKALNKLLIILEKKRVR